MPAIPDGIILLQRTTKTNGISKAIKAAAKHFSNIFNPWPWCIKRAVGT